MVETILFLTAIFVVALLYSSVGHGGASGYLAVMALFVVAPEYLRPTALFLNLIVSSLGTIAFYRKGYFRNRLFWPLALAAIPFAYIGGQLSLGDMYFRLLLACALIVAISRLFIKAAPEERFRLPSAKVLVPIGGAMGLVSGLIGVGGGIFLTPLVILLRWSSAKTAAAIFAPFIFVNSLAGLLGLQPSLSDFHPHLMGMAVTVLMAGFLGARWGSGWAQSRHIRCALAGVLMLAVFKLVIS
ncbi:MAG: sulfite exporter TauE/SafE family protein [Opitutales bacterium]|nr:sulfite exporter TauE/SafE family protein [Opitutales bacterium]